MNLSMYKNIKKRNSNKLSEKLESILKVESVGSLQVDDKDDFDNL